MRIALVSQEYPPETAKGGLGTQTFLKAHGLAALGHEVYVVSRSPTGKPTHKKTGKVWVARVGSFSNGFSAHTDIADWLTHSAMVSAEIEALHARKPLDLIDCPEWAAEGFVHFLNRTPWQSIPTVVQLHGPLVMFAHTMGWPDTTSELYRVGTAMESACVRLADAVFSSSQCSIDWCAKHYGLNGKHVPVLHTGVDTKRFSPRFVTKAKRPTIIFAGKLARNKGVHLLVKAAVRLAREFPQLHLRLLGRGEQNIGDELRHIARDCESLLDLPGFVDSAELPEEFSRAHIFAAPSEYEGGPGFVYLEAMACGLPVIACAGSGAAEMVREGKNGLLVPPQDVSALTAALRSLLKNDTRRESMGRFARRFVLAEADSRECVQQVEAFYAGVVSRQGKRGKSS